MPTGKKRIDEIDFVKCVLIILMVAFHIVYFADSHLYAKHVVYTFHMPLFLIISGYMLRMDKPWREHLRSMFWIAVPYVVMETGYVLMASVLPIREHIDVLSPLVLADKLFLHPIGPYWYLHNLVVCSMVCHAVFRFVNAGSFPCFIISGLLLYLSSRYLFTDNFIVNAMYFLGGSVIRRSGMALLDVFKPSLWALLPVAVLVSIPANLHSSTAGGVMTACLMFCFLLSCYRFPGGRLLRCMLFIGRNTLLVLLFSPVFTATAKLYQPLLVGIDPSGILFMAITVAIAVAGSIGIARLLDMLHISRFMFGRKTIA